MNDDNQISFSEYLQCLSVISNKATSEDKQKFAFKLYDYDHDGFISTSDLTIVLAMTLRENGLVITKQQIDQIVMATMKEAGKADINQMSFDDYINLDSKNPYMLSHLTMNISGYVIIINNKSIITILTCIFYRIIAEYSKVKNISFSSRIMTPR